MITQDQLRDVVGATAYDRDGDKIGKVDDSYTDTGGRYVRYLAVSTGWFGIPLIPNYFIGNQVDILASIFTLFSALGTIWGVMAYREFTKSIEIVMEARDAARRSASKATSTLRANASASLVDLGDGVLAVCLTTKMGTINPSLVVELLEKLEKMCFRDALSTILTIRVAWRSVLRERRS